MAERNISVSAFRKGTERFQDILLEVMPELLNEPGYRVVPYKYIGLLNPSEPRNFKSEFLVTKNKDRSIFTSFRNEQLAILMPYIRLYKIGTKKAIGSVSPVGKREEKQILMKTAYEVEDFDPYSATLVTNDAASDVGAGGVERITYVIRNERPSDQDITLTIDLAFDNLYSFLNSDLTELITFPFQTIASDKQHIEEKTLKIEVGWSEPDDPTEVLLTREEKSIFLGMKEVFDLYIVDHTINFDHDGSVRVSVVYQAAREGIMGRPSNNVFSLERLSVFKEVRGDIFSRFESSDRPVAVDKLFLFAETVSKIVRYLEIVEGDAIKSLEVAHEQDRMSASDKKDVVRILNDTYKQGTYKTIIAKQIDDRLANLLDGNIINTDIPVRVLRGMNEEVVTINIKSPLSKEIRRQAKQNQIQAILVVFLHDMLFGSNSTLQKDGLSAAIEHINAVLDTTAKKLFVNYLFFGIRPHLGYVQVNAFSYTPSIIGGIGDMASTAQFKYDGAFAEKVYGTEEFFEKMAVSMESLKFKHVNSLYLGPSILSSVDFNKENFINAVLNSAQTDIDNAASLSPRDSLPITSPAAIVLDGDPKSLVVASDPTTGLGGFETEEELEVWTEQHAGDSPDSQYFPIFFTKLGDIVDCLFSFDESIVSERVFPVLGTARIRTRGGKVIESFNLADLPIEMDSFRAFLVNYMIRTERKKISAQELIDAIFEKYVEPLMDFDRDNINKDNLTSAIVPRRIIPRRRNFIGKKNGHKKFLSGEEARLFKLGSDQEVLFDTSAAGDILSELNGTGAGASGPDKHYMSSKLVGDDMGDQFMLSRKRRDRPDDIGSFLLYYVDFYEFEKLDGTQKSNEENGIPHFRVGLDRGLLISADFSKIDDPKLRDARISAVTSGASTFVLWNPYNVQLTLYGNNLIDKGQLFYIDGNYLGLNSYRKMDQIGIGGYYIAMDIRGEITTSEYITKIAGIWQYNPHIQGLARLSVATEIGE